MRRAVGCGGAVLQTRRSFFAEPTQPLVSGRPGDPHRLRSGRDRPSLLSDPGHEQQTAERGETSPTMGHESLLLGRELWSAPNRAGRLSLVNNLGGNYT